MSQERIVALLEKYNSVLDRAENRAIAVIDRALVAAFDRLVAQIERKYPALVEGGSLTAIQRKTLLLQELKELLSVTGRERDYRAAIEDLLTLANADGVELGRQLLEIADRDFLQSTTTIPIEAVRFGVEEQLRYLNRWGEDFALRASEIVGQGLIQGWGVKRLISPLMTQLGVTKVRAEMIARTATISAFNVAAIEHYRTNRVDGFMWVATADDRTCPRCVARNGSVYRIDDFRPPGHPRCRCFITPVRLRWLEDGRFDKAWSRKFYADALEELGKDADGGLLPFEKSNGIERPAVPVWSPG